MTVIDTAQAVAQISAVGAPVLLLDTCSLLDVMRDPIREKFGQKRATAAMDLLGKAEAGSAMLSIVISGQVSREMTDHKDEIETECGRALQNLEDIVGRVLGVAVAYGISASSGLGLHQMNFPATARAIVDRFISASIIVNAEPDFMIRASERVIRGIAPAHRGKQSFKDCLITETYLHVAREARNAGFTEKMLFLSTNTADYTEGNRSRLHNDLERDFAGVQLDFESDFLAARYGIFPQ